MAFGFVEVSERASKALSIPVAFKAGLAFACAGPEESLSSWERSRPRVFLVAVFAPAFLGLEGASRSSAARRASFSAFLAAAAAFLASASSLIMRKGWISQSPHHKTRVTWQV